MLNDALRKIFTDKETADIIATATAARESRDTQTKFLSANPDALESTVKRLISEDASPCRAAGEKADFRNEVFIDAEILVGEATLIRTLDTTTMRGSKLYLQTLLTHPIDDVDLLRERSGALERLRRKYKIDRDAWDARMTRMKAHELDVLSLCSEPDEAIREFQDLAFFRTGLLRYLNGSPMMLTAVNTYRIVVSPAIGLLSPIVYFVLPYIIMRWKLGIPVSFKTYMWIMYKSFVASDGMMVLPQSVRWVKYLSCGLSMLFYFQSVFNSIELSQTLFAVCTLITDQIRHVRTFVSDAQQVARALWDDDLRRCFFPEEPEFPDAWASALTEGHVSDADDVKFNVLSNFGRELCEFKAFDRSACLAALRCSYAADCLIAVAKLLVPSSDRTPQAFCRVEFLDAEAGPNLVMRDLWHPCIDATKAVRNTVQLGKGKKCAPNVILTGPNAGGKSTLLRAILIATIMSQTLTIAPSSSVRMTPFTFVNSQINVPDSEGKRSLFQEEMWRARTNLERIRHLPAGRHALVVIDEIFSSTNPIEGIAGGFSIARILSSFTSCISIISTHFTYLCRLARATRGRFRNYQMPVLAIDDNNDSFTYPYRFVPGVCRQYIALELLRRSGFDEDVVDGALRVKKELTTAIGT